jgi:hypothetical protein
VNTSLAPRSLHSVPPAKAFSAQSVRQQVQRTQLQPGSACGARGSLGRCGSAEQTVTLATWPAPARRSPQERLDGEAQRAQRRQRQHLPPHKVHRLRAVLGAQADVGGQAGACGRRARNKAAQSGYHRLDNQPGDEAAAMLRLTQISGCCHP